MIPTRLADVARAVGGTLDAVPDPEAVVTGEVSVDSREVGPGGLFVAIPGTRHDGHDFAVDAVRRSGAAAVLAHYPVGVPAVIVPDTVVALGHLARAVVGRSPDLVVVGITGSAGKTSTKDLLASTLAPAMPTVAARGNNNNEIGLPLTVLRVSEETRALVAEMGARGIGHIRALTEIAPPRIGAVLNVGSAHLGEFASVEGIALAKGELVEALPADGVAVLNADDPRVRAMAARTAARVVLVGRADGADVRATDIRLLAGARPAFTLLTPEGVAPVELAYVGAHQVGNALAAAAVARELGMDVAAVAAALSAARPASRWRMEVRERADGVTVVNDAYNASPDSMRAALDALAALGADRRTWAVLGEMLELGESSEVEHSDVGRHAAKLGIDRLVVVGDDAAAIVRGAGSGEVVPDVDAAVALLDAQVRPGDVVLVKASRSIGLERVVAALLAEAAS